MSTYKTKELVENFDGFGGLDLSAPTGVGRFSVFKNFRLLPDGSAIKREGFRYIASTVGEVRGEYAYSDGGESVILSVIGSSLYRISMSSGEVTCAEVFDSSQGSVRFFSVMGVLYMYDGDRLYRYMGGCLAEECVAYVPLYGDGWMTGHTVGSVNEPFNVLSPKIRISYSVNGTFVNVLSVGMKIKSVDAIFVDGRVARTDEYSISTTDKTQITCRDIYAINELVAYVTVDTEEYRDAYFESCDRADVFDAFFDSRVFTYGGESGGRFYVSMPTEENEILREASIYGFAAPIYFPKGGAQTFAGTDKITAMNRIGDRMMIFSEHRAWVTSKLIGAEGRERRGVIVEPVSDNAGCSSDGAVILMGSEPISVSLGGIYKWSIDREFEDRIILSKISGKLDFGRDRSFWRNISICYNRGDNEIWFGNTASPSGEVLVYNCESRTWYSYDGIHADRFFEVGESVAFRKGDAIYCFFGGEGYDVYEWGESDIEAVIESAVFDFSTPSRKKHISGLYLSCLLDGGSMRLELLDGKSLADVALDEKNVSEINNGVYFFNLRLRTSRCKRAFFRLSARTRSRQRLFGVSFLAS